MGFGFCREVGAEGYGAVEGSRCINIKGWGGLGVLGLSFIERFY